MLLSAAGIFKSFGDNLILDDLTFTINEGDRIGLIGVNGAGKSTLLRVMTGEYEAEKGELSKSGNLRVGYLQQNSGLDSGHTIIEEARGVFSALLGIEQELHALSDKMAACSEDAELSSLAAEYDRLSALFEAGDGYAVPVKINTVLTGMGFPSEVYGRVIDSLSGGEKTRLAIAKLLLEEPSLLILDEPTNHLDFSTVMWLEDYLKSYKGALLIVSHDRYFLDQLVTSVWELEQRKLYFYPGNYSKYKLLKAERQESQRRAYEKQQAQIASMLDYAQRNIVRASTSNSAKSRLHQVANMELIEKPLSAPKSPSFSFETTSAPVKELLHVKNLSLKVGERSGRKTLSQNINFDLFRGDKCAIIGANGIGKTTFLKSLLDMIPQEGDIRWGAGITKGYYDQESEHLTPTNTVLDELWSRFPYAPQQDMRNMLGRVLITGEECYKTVSVLSGGERARLGLAILMAEKRNTLFLDEPTNHLDLASREALEKGLKEFDGTLLFVSHDRYLLNVVPTKIAELSESGIRVYEGGFDDYLAAKQKQQSESASEAAKSAALSQSGEGYYRSKKQRSEEAKRKKRLSELENLIETLDGQIASLGETMADPEVASDYARLQETCDQIETLRAEHDAAMEEWLLLNDEIVRGE